MITLPAWLGIVLVLIFTLVCGVAAGALIHGWEAEATIADLRWAELMRRLDDERRSELGE